MQFDAVAVLYTAKLGDGEVGVRCGRDLGSWAVPVFLNPWPSSIFCF